MKTSTRAILVATTLLISNAAFSICSNWKSERIGTLDTNYVDEASGLAASKVKAGSFLWINDSGAREVIYASTVNGQISRSVSLSGFSNRDFEAMATGPCFDNKAESCIYIADIGDNRESRTDLKIGVFKENDFWTKSSIAPVSIVRFQYPNRSANAESMLITPDAKALIFTKSKNGISRIFQVEANARVTELGTLDIKNLTRTSGDAVLVTDATISADGSKILILTYGEILEFNTSAILNNGGRTMTRGTDYEVIKGPGLEQPETIAYTSADSFIVSTETENGGVAPIISYSCVK